MLRLRNITVILVILLVLGGCRGRITERHFKDQDILDRAKAIAIEYLKSMYKLDVTITEKRDDA
ncbi:hypothetical protein D3C74_484260 [compost metagenome]|jgi:hypothetical protein